MHKRGSGVVGIFNVQVGHPFYTRNFSAWAGSLCDGVVLVSFAGVALEPHQARVCDA